MLKYTRDIEDEYSADCILEIGRNKTAESFLACCVPKLESAGGALVGDVLANEVDADGGLCYDESTFSFSSNWLFTNLSIMLVLPVPLSPRKMIL